MARLHVRFCYNLLVFGCLFGFYLILLLNEKSFFVSKNHLLHHSTKTTQKEATFTIKSKDEHFSLNTPQIPENSKPKSSPSLSRPSPTPEPPPIDPQIVQNKDSKEEPNPPRIRYPNLLKRVDNLIIDPEHYDITFTSQMTAERVLFFHYLLQLWPGYSLDPSQSQQSKVQKEIDALNLPERLSIHFYIAESFSPYPINTLRNKAIDQVHTSHFWLTDMDMWPMQKTYDTLLSLPHKYLDQEKLAIIVPAYEIFKPKKICISFETCARYMISAMPQSKIELEACIKEEKCDKFRPKQHLHNYYPHTFFTDNTSAVFPVRCFVGKTQEPYVVVRKTRRLPYFDERFINYGYNKVQWLEHLRYLGYNYVVLNNAFAVDIPHPRSRYLNDYIHEIGAKKGKHIEMQDVYNQFIKELRSFPSHEVVHKC